MTTVLVAGAVASKHRHGGSAWVRTSWAEGLRTLGFDVLFVEQLAPGVAVDAHGAPAEPAASANAAAFAAAMRAAGLEGSAWLLDPDGEAVRGPSREALLDHAAGAALCVNISGHLRDRALLDLATRRAFVDLDPGYTQVWMAQGLDVGAAGHDLYATVGPNVGTARSPLPGGGVRWIGVRQPVVLDRWPVAEGPFTRFTTVGSWRGAFGPLEWEGKTYGVKAHEFRRIADLPRRAGVPCEVALDIHPADEADAQRLRDGGWTLADPAQVAGDADAFAAYVRGSGGEVSAAQGVYVAGRTGWCSDRTVRYLASGRPAVVQDTAMGEELDHGAGLLTFRTVDEAADRLQQVLGDERHHRAAARRIAEERFAPGPALAPLLEAAGVAP